jgi:hypothetical protein
LSYVIQKVISGVPITVGHSQRTADGKKAKLTTENADTVAMYEPSIPAMWADRQACSSVGGRTNFRMSRPASTIPSKPNTTGTTPTRAQLGPGRTTPRTTSAPLTPNVNSAAAQSIARGP